MLLYELPVAILLIKLSTLSKLNVKIKFSAFSKCSLFKVKELIEGATFLVVTLKLESSNFNNSE